MRNCRTLLIHVLVALFALTVGAEAFAAGKANTPKPRKDVMKKFNLKEDPGTDPDPEKVFMRNGEAFTIIKIYKVDTREGRQEGWIRYRHMQMQDLEVYQEDEDYVWVWFWKQDANPPKIRYNTDDRGRRVEIIEHTPEQIELFKQLREEFEDLTPAPAGRTVVFKRSSEGLPTAGSWRNSATTADMNGDGFLDLVLPPQRGPAGVPMIFLGDGEGNWRNWDGLSFPFAVNYGSVSAGDLNGDGHLDLALAVHLRGPVVFLGDGKGAFTDGGKGLPADYPTRRLRLGDVDADGDLDLVSIFEGPVQGGSTMAGAVKVKAFLNDGTGASWTSIDVNEPNLTLGGDWMELADLNGDEYPDIVGSSVYYNGRTLVHLSKGPAEWEAFGEGVFPNNSYYVALVTGKFTGGKRDDAIMAFQRGWRWEVDPELVPPPKSGRLSGIERVTWNEDGTITREPVIRWLGVGQELGAMGAGDFDGDGNLDFAFVDTDLIELAVMLGDGKGGFTQATVEGVTLPDTSIYDIHVADVNADGRPDLVFLYEASETKKIGMVRVYLGMGVKGDGGA